MKSTAVIACGAKTKVDQQQQETEELKPQLSLRDQAGLGLAFALLLFLEVLSRLKVLK
jgi:hypothetical protein